MEDSFDPGLIRPSFWSEQIEVVIGRAGSKYTFLVHTSILKKYTDYFHNALRAQRSDRADWVEGATKRVEIEELLHGTDYPNDHEIFSVFLWALY